MVINIMFYHSSICHNFLYHQFIWHLCYLRQELWIPFVFACFHEHELEFKRNFFHNIICKSFYSILCVLFEALCAHFSLCNSWDISFEHRLHKLDDDSFLYLFIPNVNENIQHLIYHNSTTWYCKPLKLKNNLSKTINCEWMQKSSQWK